MINVVKRDVRVSANYKAHKSIGLGWENGPLPSYGVNYYMMR
jgi:hypothetical protein